MSTPDEVIAFYLPQFHPIPENDEFWQPGFTEWTNVTAARPLMRGHRQPRLPSDLGFYDLRVPEVRSAQADLARRYGVTAFCYWSYWFAGRKVLERPLLDVIHTGEPNFPLCIGWANQSWTGIWHGAPHKVLIEQTYPGPDDHRRHFDSLLETFSDPRYLHIDGRPLFLIFEPWSIPEIESVIDLWRNRAEQAGLGGLFLVGRSEGSWYPIEHGFDGSVATKLPKVRTHGHLLHRGPTVAKYKNESRWVTSFAWDEHFPCVLPGWDNTPRSGRNGLVLKGSTPELFREQVRIAVAKLASLPPGRRLLWVKSWNEWAEGNILEPDRDFGLAYLEALSKGIAHPADKVPPKFAVSWSADRSSALKTAISSSMRRVAAGEGALARRRQDGPIPVLFMIDCEPDSRMVNPDSPGELAGFEACHEDLSRWREHAASVTGEPVHFNWFFRMDRQIEKCFGSAGVFPERYPQIVDDVLGAGDAIGLHPHAWRWEEDLGTWYGDYADWKYPLENLELGVNTFRTLFGHAPEMIRLGDGILSNEIIARAEAEGVHYDLTLEPGRPSQPLPEMPYVAPLIGEWANELQPDWTRVPREPYFPDPADYRRPLRSGTRGIQMIPMTSGSPWLGRSITKRIQAIRTNGYRYRNQRQLLYMALPGWHGEDSYSEMLKRSLAAQRRPYLSLAIRTDRPLQPERWRRIDRCLYDLLAQQEQHRLVFCTPSKALDLLGMPVLRT